MPIDYSHYPPNWLTEIRPRILARAWNRCECEGECGRGHGGRCEALNHMPHPVTRSLVVLSIAHLDRDKSNHEVDDDRLKAMCQACHLKYDMAHHVERRRLARDAALGQLQLIESRDA